MLAESKRMQKLAKKWRFTKARRLKYTNLDYLDGLRPEGWPEGWPEGDDSWLCDAAELVGAAMQAGVSPPSSVSETMVAARRKQLQIVLDFAWLGLPTRRTLRSVAIMGLVS